MCREARCYGRAARERRAGCLQRRRHRGDPGGGGRAGWARLAKDPGSGDVAVAAFAVSRELGAAGQVDREFEHAECDPFGTALLERSVLRGNRGVSPHQSLSEIDLAAADFREAQLALLLRSDAAGDAADARHLTTLRNRTSATVSLPRAAVDLRSEVCSQGAPRLSRCKGSGILVGV